MKEKLSIIKIGGNIIEQDDLLKEFLRKFSEIKGLKLLVHGGGKSATALCERLNIEQHIVDGRRLTDAATLDVIIMVYAGLINKKIVGNLQSLNCNSIGLSGADGNIIKSQKRILRNIDYGFVGDILDNGINSDQIDGFLKSSLIPVICPLTHDGLGNLFNTNADTIAAKIAISMSHLYNVSLIYCFEKQGVLSTLENDKSLISELNYDEYLVLKENKIINSGMIPKLENAFEAAGRGVFDVKICLWKEVNNNADIPFGTKITA